MSAVDASPAKKNPAFDEPDEPHWHRLISQTAYFLAESRGFAAGSEIDDWLEAEAIVKAQLQRE